MYGAHRFLYNNAITAASMLTVSSQRSGVVTGAAKEGTGSAQMQSYGQYSGESDLMLLVQIHDISAGQEIGQALYRWRTSETALGAWEASDITTHSTASTLTAGVKIQFVTGTGDDFENLDKWQFRALATWGPARMLNLDRGTVFQTDDSTSVTIVIDLGTPVNITACVLFGHNLTDDATVTLQAHTSDSWGAPSYSQALSVSADMPVTQYLDEEYCYWRMVISDAANPDGYVEIGNLYLGTYMELAVETADWGSSEELLFHQAEVKNEAGEVQEAVYAEQFRYSLSYSDIGNDDIDLLQTMFRTLRNTSSGKSTPLFFHRFSDIAGDVYLMRISGSLPRTWSNYLGNSIVLQLEEVVNSRGR